MYRATLSLHLENRHALKSATLPLSVFTAFRGVHFCLPGAPEGAVLQTTAGGPQSFAGYLGAKRKAVLLLTVFMSVAAAVYRMARWVTAAFLRSTNERRKHALLGKVWSRPSSSLLLAAVLQAEQYLCAFSPWGAISNSCG